MGHLIGQRLPGAAAAGAAETRAELRQVAELVRHNDAATRAQIATGTRVAGLSVDGHDQAREVLAGRRPTPYAHRVYTYVALAMYDATIATWESKYYYKRERPARLDRIG